MNLQSYLDELGVNYRVSQHQPTFTSQDLAAAEHIPGQKVIKPVVVRADGNWVMCVLPASHRVDLGKLRDQLQADEVMLADESALERLCPDCELGAEPPIGKLFGLPTLMDESVATDDVVTFQAGTHTNAVTMQLADYRRVTGAQTAQFGRHI
jgi:Ala-tRNA(Pro) deacylase